MDLAKFARLLQTKCLYFANAREFEDRFEGCLSRPSLEKFFQASDWTNIPPPQRPDLVPKIMTMAADQIAVNCWHISESENYMMWSKYAAAIGQGGIAIQSTVGRLRDSLSRVEESLWIAEVKYIDYEKDEFENWKDSLQWFTHKRQQFSGEQELRALITNYQQHGREVPCNLTTLIESVYVAPNSPAYVSDVVKGICERFGLVIAVQASSIADLPPHFRVIP